MPTWFEYGVAIACWVIVVLFLVQVCVWVGLFLLVKKALKRARTDDQKDQIIQRLSNFRIQTRPVIEYLLDRVPEQIVYVPEVFSAAEAATIALNYIKDQFQ